MISWTEILEEQSSDPNWILVTVGAARGSTPRDSGVKMLVGPTEIRGTIGGGQLEYVVIEKSRRMLENELASTHELMQLPLGPELTQCCGGYTEIMLEKLNSADLTCFNDVRVEQSDFSDYALITSWTEDKVQRQLFPYSSATQHTDADFALALQEAQDFGTCSILEASRYSGEFKLVEPMETNRFELVIFGAGHVGRALVHTFAALPCKIHWVDSRAAEFPKTIPFNVKKHTDINPTNFVQKAAKGSYFLVMTHSHKLDQELVAEILKRKDSAYLGLIGSKTKKSRFFNRLKTAGFSDAELLQVTCPIGITGVGGKHPTEIAISVAAEILQLHARRQHAVSSDQDAKGNKVAFGGH
ncbi:xanthine dehydrogenase accessory protein XdhC [Sneathiella glossodoripedis]|uniref:xanthine dehydrogenase accessory protein XdhC n=1 Tax=Sneathiella glossodoripedis TaxID=418853 RepID=UPI0004723BA0|nr:xanthine dehydrogenase accessory protein XdhC [Sneathiella glossodoripedis]